MEELRMGARIARYRKENGLTQEALANRLGVTNQAVSKWEGDVCCPDIQLLPQRGLFRFRHRLRQNVRRPEGGKVIADNAFSVGPVAAEVLIQLLTGGQIQARAADEEDETQRPELYGKQQT